MLVFTETRYSSKKLNFWKLDNKPSSVSPQNALTGLNK